MAALSTGICKIRFTSLPGGAIGIAYGAATKGCESMLTANQEQFVQNIIQGMNQADAYRSAYPNSKGSAKTVHEAASRLMGNSKVLARLTELRQELATPAIMSAQKRLEWLTGIIKSKEETTGDKLRAVDIMNKMQGEYATKVEGNLGITKLEDLI